MDDIPGVAAQGTKEGPVSVHNNEAKRLVGFQELAQSLGMELIVAKVQRSIDRLERFKVYVDLAFFAF